MDVDAMLKLYGDTEDLTLSDNLKANDVNDGCPYQEFGISNTTEAHERTGQIRYL